MRLNVKERKYSNYESIQLVLTDHQKGKYSAPHISEVRSELTRQKLLWS